MFRLVTKIIDIKKTGERKDGNFKVSTLRLKVRIKDFIPKSPKPPPHIKGKSVWVTREYPHPFEPKKGNEIVVSLKELPQLIPISSDDVNRDGHKEVLLKNEFMDVTILPHLGARIGSLKYKGREYFGSKIEHKSRKWIDVGGIFDTTDGKIPGSLWNAEFKYQETKDKRINKKHTTISTNHCRLVHDKKGLVIVKHFSLHPKYPLLTEKTKITAKRKKNIIYSKYLPVNVIEPETALYVPTEEKLEHRYYQKESVLALWFPIEYCGLRLGSFLVGESNGSFLYATQQQKTEHLTLRHSINVLLICLFSEKRELKKGKSFTYSCIYAFGDEYIVTRDLIAIRAKSTEKTFFIVRANDKFKGELKWDNMIVKLKPLEIKDVGILWVN